MVVSIFYYFYELSKIWNYEIKIEFTKRIFLLLCTQIIEKLWKAKVFFFSDRFVDIFGACRINFLDLIAIEAFLLIIFYNMIEGEPKRKLKKLELSEFSL